MKQIVILGGGFAGIAAALAIKKSLSKKDAKVVLIDKNSFHLFTPSLYEVATSEEPKSNIAIPFKEIFGKRIEIIQAEVEKIDSVKQVVMLGKQPSTSLRQKVSSLSEQHEPKGFGEISYDYLLIALGSEPAYFHIPGLKENSIALKSLREAVMVRNKILTMCCKEGLPNGRQGECNKKVQVVIGGGGFSGTELAAELLTYKKKIARQHHLDPSCLQVTIIQGSDRLLKELDPHVSTIAKKRIKSKNVTFAFGGHISKVTKTSVFTDDNKVYPYDLLIWTGGVQANITAWKSNLPVNKRGQIIVNNSLQVQGRQHIFAAGDIAQYIDTKTQKPAPTVAQVAEDEGKIAGENITRLLQHKQLTNYRYRHIGYVVPLRGKYAAAELMGWLHFDGFIGWIVQQIIFLYYLIKILPLWKALRRWNTFESDLEQ